MWVNRRYWEADDSLKEIGPSKDFRSGSGEVLRILKKALSHRHDIVRVEPNRSAFLLGASNIQA